VTRSRFRIIASCLLNNLAYKIRLLTGNIDTDKGASHYGRSLEDSLAYIERVFADYLSYGGIAPADLAGRRVLEVGPGDNLGVALKMIAAGCSQVIAVDKFAAKSDPAQQLRIYRALRDAMPPNERKRFDEAASVLHGFELNPARLECLRGASLEAAARMLEPESFDFIVSRAVLMEITDADAAFSAMDRLLAPGGIMIHKIAPIHDYRMFRDFGYGPLEYMTIPGWLYGKMVSDVGGPNRKTVRYYRDKMAAMGYAPKVHIVKLIGGGVTYPPGMFAAPAKSEEYADARAELRRVRSRLAREFRQIDDDDLIVEDIFLAAVKPGRKPARSGSARVRELSAT
jgi:SAM-dependent methyltransferase